MEKRKQLLDSLDAAFAAKKPKIHHAKAAPGVVRAAPGVVNTAPSVARAAPGVVKPKQAGNKAKAKSQQQQQRPDKPKTDPLYTPLSDSLMPRKVAGSSKPRHNIKVLEVQLAAMALKKPSATEDFVEKIKSKALQLGNPHKAKCNANAASVASQFAKRMSQTQRRAAGFHSATPAIPYATAMTLNEMWKQYMTDLIGNEGIAASATAGAAFETCPFGAKLLKADFHGCLLRVVRASNPGVLGLQGIVLDELKNVFRLLTPKDKVVVVPKAGSSFAFELNATTFRFEGATRTA
ncbi:hypothetical protein ACHHYP_13741 [Achlya hypogyna]|uniref:Uncharacterized protein n=1 Tax=Achlya hypogyna TaxID=1202772 RepID=A0A1V9YEU4_ACHHY|nr:hypothetical protein ACHHYP_13741 [Achlya hypogyna]